MNRIRACVICLLIAFSMPGRATAGFRILDRLSVTNPAPSYKDYFGMSVAPLGAGRFVVGMPQDSTVASNWGEAYIMGASGTTLAVITNPAPQAYDRFGCAVAGLPDGRFVVGADWDNEGASEAGSAYLYDTNGILLAAITNPSPATFDLFGHAITPLGAGGFAIGAPYDDGGTTDVGCVFIYDANGALRRAVTNPVPAADDRFGMSLGCAGSNLLVGVPYDDAGATNAGSVCVYDPNGNLLLTITNPTPVADDYFGWAVAGIGDDRIAVSAISDDTCTSNGGSVYVYDLGGALILTVTNPAGAEFDSFGSAIAEIGERRLLIGAASGGYMNTGAAHIYALNGRRLASLTNTTFAWDESFGHAVCRLGDSGFAVTAPYYESGGSGDRHKYGTVYVYSFEEGRSYYVNDSTLAGDTWCTAAGSDANAGTNPAAPKATFQSVVNSHDLEPGDTVYIDTGHFLQSTNFEIGSNDCGSSTSYVSIRGSPQGVTIDRGSTAIGAVGLYLNKADYVRIANLNVTGGLYGAWLDADHCVLSNVTIRNAGDAGVRLAGVHSNRLERVTIRDCGNDGIYLLSTSDHLFRGVEIRSCGDYGVYGDHAERNVFENSLIWSNANMGVMYVWDSLSNRIRGSTIALNGLRQIYISGGATSLQLDNSVVLASGTSNYCVFLNRSYKGMGTGRYSGDYNCLRAENGAFVGGFDGFDISGGPYNYAALADWQSYISQDAHSLSADPLFVSRAGDFHLRSSAPSGTFVKALDGWTSFPGENSPCIDAGDPAESCEAEPQPNGGRLNIGAYGNTPEASLPRVTRYYVNDGSTAGDAWCTAPGNDANPGTSPASPKATIQDVLSDYDLGAGDTVYVDTGRYVLTNDITIAAADGGESNLYMSIRGSPAGTVFDGGSTNGGPGVVLSHVKGVQLRDLTISNAYYGVRIAGDFSSSDCRDFALSNITIRSGGDYGVVIEDAPYGRLDALDISGVHHGISIYHSRGNRIAHCAIHNNRGDGIRIRYFSGGNSVVNCTVALNRGKQIYTSDCDTAVDVSNCIVVASGNGSACIARQHTSTQLCNPHGCWYVDGAGHYSGDYNDFSAVNGADVGQYNSDGHYPTLADWQSHVTQDVHSVSADPLFVDGAGGDLHLRSAAASGTYVKATGLWTQYPRENSPGIDAGDPAAAFDSEPGWNGGRLNLGAYGNTPEASRSAFRVYYVNDSSTAGDAWCTAPGDDANPGYLPALPKATMQSVVTTYDLEPGDKVFVDTGVYRVTNSCHIRTNDSGSASDRVCFIANTGRVVIVITNYAFGFYLEGAEYVDVSGFTISNAHTGVYCFYAWDCGIRDITVRDATVGIKLEYGGYHQVKGCDVRDGGEGFMIYESVHNWIMNSVAWSNRDDGLWIMHGSAPTHVYCCTIGCNGYKQIDLAHNTTLLDMWNCIVVASGSDNCCIWQYDEGYGPATYTGDYNLLYAVNNACLGGYWRYRGYPYPSETYYSTLSSWQAHSTQDAHSISSDPLFVGNDGDLHLRSSAPQGTYVAALGAWTNFPGQDSPGIDAGHETDSCALEPQWDGGIVDAGAYGNTPFASRSADADGDRLSDSIEKYRYGSDPNDADSDHDGMGDRFEILAGTCATNGSSVFESDGAIPAGSANSRFVLQWPSAEGRTYRIQSSTGAQINFTNHVTGIPATTPLNSYTVTVTGVEKEMFRVGLE